MQTLKVNIKEFKNIVKKIIKEEEDGYSYMDRHFSTDEFEDRYAGDEIYMIAQKLYEIAELYENIGDSQNAQKYRAEADNLSTD